ncbi:MAG: hypothetical protein ACLTDF_08515 [Coprococcus sp.]
MEAFDKEKTVGKLQVKMKVTVKIRLLNGEKSTRNAQGSISPTLYKDGSLLMSEVIIFK